MTESEAKARAQRIIERCYERTKAVLVEPDGLEQLTPTRMTDHLRDEIATELIEVTHEIKSQGEPPRTPGP